MIEMGLSKKEWSPPRRRRGVIAGKPLYGLHKGPKV
jgi:hypothetical protein